MQAKEIGLGFTPQEISLLVQSWDDIAHLTSVPQAQIREVQLSLVSFPDPQHMQNSCWGLKIDAIFIN